ncbi:MAG: hypothetical protein ACR2PK_19445 [Acidimicrobiales bacterium]
MIDSDAALAALLSSSGTGSRPSAGPVVAALAGGDLCRTLGGRGDVSSRLGLDTTLVDVNAGRLFTGEKAIGPFVAHVVLRGRWWHGPTAVVMNSQWMGEWDMAPRSHPGDGLFDAIEGQLGFRERLLARRRAPSGDHVPHPQLRLSRRNSYEFEFDRPRLLVSDGVTLGRYRQVRIVMLEEAIRVAV